MPEKESAPLVNTPENRADVAYRRNYRLLSYLARRRLYIPADEVEGVIHETFVVFLQNAAKVMQTEADERSWLIGTIFNVARHYWRKHHPTEELPEDLAAYVDPCRVAEEAETRLTLVGVFRDLPARCRELLRRRYAEGYTPAEIAASETLTHGSAKNLISKCLLAARAAFQRLRGSGS
jgi:RNA polymerase sigma factor (sigma-70 family)